MHVYSFVSVYICGRDAHFISEALLLIDCYDAFQSIFNSENKQNHIYFYGSYVIVLSYNMIPVIETKAHMTQLHDFITLLISSQNPLVH